MLTRRTALAALLALTALSVASCGGQAGTDEPSSTTSSTQTAAPGPTSGSTTSTPETVLPLLDAHAHLLPTWTTDELEGYATDGGFTGVVVYGPADAAGLERANPEFWVAFHFMRAITASDVEAALDAVDGGARGVGELSIRHFGTGGDAVAHPADDPILLTLYEGLAERDAILTFHFDWEPRYADELHAALASAPDLTSVWAHAGDAQPEDLEPYLATYPGLHIDLSSRTEVEAFAGRGGFSVEEMSIARPGTTDLENDWASLIESYPDRFLFGSDIGPAQRHTQVAEIAAWYVEVLSDLDPDTAQAVGHGNAERIFFG